VELAALAQGDLGIFAPRERAALEFAEALTRDSNHVGDELFARLRQYFDEGEVVEIAAVAGLFNYFNRFNNALQMEPTR
jgi:alkylhydroperoxidase family enzyme